MAEIAGGSAPNQQLPNEERLIGVPPLVHQAQQAFARDLAQLLKERPGQWVAYHGSQRIGFGCTQAELYGECLRRGINEDEFVVQCIEPETGVMVLLGGRSAG
jgi:hypothetical protein